MRTEVWVGLPVSVFYGASPRAKEHRGEIIDIEVEHVSFDCTAYTPVIRLEDGKIVRGGEVWWKTRQEDQ